jgi:hypothetical protein
MVKPRLKMLRPIYLAHERQVFKTAGLDHLLPNDGKPSNTDQLINELTKKAKADPEILKKLMAALQA